VAKRSFAALSLSPDRVAEEKRGETGGPSMQNIEGPSAPRSMAGSGGWGPEPAPLREERQGPWTATALARPVYAPATRTAITQKGYWPKRQAARQQVAGSHPSQPLPFGSRCFSSGSAQDSDGDCEACHNMGFQNRGTVHRVCTMPRCRRLDADADDISGDCRRLYKEGNSPMGRPIWHMNCPTERWEQGRYVGIQSVYIRRGNPAR
jgi:hypothetical protein